MPRIKYKYGRNFGILEERLSGKSYSEIAKQYHLSDARIRGIIRSLTHRLSRYLRQIENLKGEDNGRSKARKSKKLLQ